MFDTERFIVEIQDRPALYDVQSKDYANRELKAKLWMEIGQEVVAHWADLGPEDKNKAVKDLMKKWKNIRDSYMKEVKSETTTVSGESAPKKKRKKQKESTQIPQITTILNESLQLQKLNNDSDAKGNRAFLMSFVPNMDSMTPDLAMETRYEITNLFRNIQRNERNRSIPSNLSKFLYQTNQDSPGNSGSRAYHETLSPMNSVASPQNDTASDTSTENYDYFNVLQYIP